MYTLSFEQEGATVANQKALVTHSSAAKSDTTAKSSATNGAISESDALNRLLTAAVISRQFCQQLLKNPGAAIAGGYHNEQFALSTAEIARLSTIQATTLSEFAHALDLVLA